MSPLLQMSFLFRLPQSLEHSSLCYIVNSYELSILHKVMYVHKIKKSNKQYAKSSHSIALNLSLAFSQADLRLYICKRVYKFLFNPFPITALTLSPAAFNTDMLHHFTPNLCAPPTKGQERSHPRELALALVHLLKSSSPRKHIFVL